MKKDFGTLSDRTHDILPLINELVDEWGYNLEKRKPGVAYITPDGKPVTDLDLACYLSALASKRAVVNLPEYKSRRGATVTEGEVVLDKDNRHGRIINLGSNQKTFSFTVVVEDANVITADSVGRPRAFMIQDLTGEWHDGWKEIQIMPTGLAKDVFDSLCGNDHKVRFKDFIHPLRWTSVFSKNFRLAKFAADVRIADQVKFLKKETKRLREELEIPPKVWSKSSSVGKTKSIPVQAYESFMEGVEMTGEYSEFPTTQDGYEEAMNLLRRLSERQRMLRFHIRASEYSWHRHLSKALGSASTDAWVKGSVNAVTPAPAWAKNKVWATGYKTSDKAKTHFARLEVEPGVFYRFRTMQKSERVAA